MSDTIFALSSAPGRAGVAVVRVSGPETERIVRGLTGLTMPSPRSAVLRTLQGGDGLPIDQALVIWMPGPASFTGEDVAEFHVHGGRAIVSSLLGRLAQLSARPAERGEFTRRAVENGKLDLTQAEAILDLVDADTDAQRRQALRQYRGALGALYEDWRLRLIKALAWVEAEIDFADDDLEGDPAERSRAEAAKILQEIQAHTNDSRRGEIIREGIHLTVIGPPNAGKSSLINALARREIAIVSEMAGTTRDVIEVRLDLGGYVVVLADTAGLRATADAVEAEGVKRALARAEAADAIILMVDASAEYPFDGVPPDARKTADLVVFNKSDLGGVAHAAGELRMSLKSGDGWDRFEAALQCLVSDLAERGSDAPVITRSRHRAALGEAANALSRSLLEQKTELFAEDLRLAVRSIGQITGRVDVEELLDVVFHDFCIGK
jgi:tRNA modification GTPase